MTALAVGVITVGVATVLALALLKAAAVTLDRHGREMIADLEAPTFATAIADLNASPRCSCAHPLGSST